MNFYPFKIIFFSKQLFLSDRKSETYPLKWEYVDFSKSQIFIGKALDKFGNEKNTKGNKTTFFHIPIELKELLLEWKNQQQSELAQFSIKQTDDQLVFTFNDPKGNINQPLHTDYLNYRMKPIERGHKHLAHATPHKLQHTVQLLLKSLERL